MARELNIPEKSTKGTAPASADEYVDATAPESADEPTEPTRKLSLVFPESDHRKTKGGAGLRGKTMLAEILELSRARNRADEGYKWPADVVASALAQAAADADYKWPADVVASVLVQAAAEGYQLPAVRTRRPAAKKATAAKPGE